MSTNLELTSIFNEINPYIFSSRGIDRNYQTNPRVVDSSKSYLIAHGSEVPLYVIGNTLDFYTDENDSYHILPTVYKLRYPEHVSYKSLGKIFLGAFKHAQTLVKIVLREEFTYYVSKGTILDQDLEPLIQMTYILDNEDLWGNSYETTFNRDRLKLYINRKVFSDCFKDTDRQMYNLIRNRLLTLLVNSDIPILIKQDIDLTFKTDIPKFKSMDKYKNILKDAEETVTKFMVTYLQNTGSL